MPILHERMEGQSTLFLGNLKQKKTYLTFQWNIASETEIEDADWIFNVNPISYQGMMENTLDPTHAPFTHEGMSGFADIPFSPNDIIPMEKFEAINFGIGGFTMSHSPYQLYTAQKGGFDTETQRIFTPPCTMSVKSLPFFRKCLQIHAAFRNISFKSCYAPHKWLSNLYITTP